MQKVVLSKVPCDVQPSWSDDDDICIRKPAVKKQRKVSVVGLRVCSSKKSTKNTGVGAVQSRVKKSRIL